MNNPDRSSLAKRRQQIAKWNAIWQILLAPAHEEADLKLAEPPNEGGEDNE